MIGKHLICQFYNKQMYRCSTQKQVDSNEKKYCDKIIEKYIKCMKRQEHCNSQKFTQVNF